MTFIEKDGFYDPKDSEDPKTIHGGRNSSGFFVVQGFRGICIAFDQVTVSNKGSHSALLWDCRLAIMSNSIRAFLSLPLLTATSLANFVIIVQF